MDRTLQVKREELIVLKEYVSSEIFQKYVCKPMREYQKLQTNDFFSDSLKESWRKGGRVEATKHFFNLLGQIETDLKNVQHELGEA